MTVQLPFANRREAGQSLGRLLKLEHAPGSGALILGLVRGGAVIANHAAEVAGCPWDVMIVRKIGAPHQQEYAVGAYTESGEVIANRQVLREMHLDDDWLELQRFKAAGECERLQRDLRGAQRPPSLTGREVFLCDDGMATGLTMFAAVDAALKAGASRVVVAVPVLPPEALRRLQRMKVECCYLACPGDFRAVGQYYRDFTPVASHAVRSLLATRPTGT